MRSPGNILTIAGLIGLSTTMGLPILAQNESQVLRADPPASVQADAAQTPSLIINNRVVMTIPTEAAGLSPAERADILRKRLGPILTMPDLRAEDVEIRQKRQYQDAAIYIRDRLLITVDRDLAKAHSSTPGVLAEEWASTLRELLPQVNIGVYTNIGPQVVLNNRILMSFPTGADGLRPEERANIIRLRLGPILTLPNLTAEDVEVRQRETGQTAGIYVRDILLVSVDQKLAAAHRTTPEKLAEVWAKNIQDVLPEVRIAVRPSEVKERPITSAAPVDNDETRPPRR